MTISRKILPASDMEKALDEERVFVKVGREFFLARKKGVHLFDGCEFVIQVEAGPNKARGLLTNIDDNREGREFIILER